MEAVKTSEPTVTPRSPAALAKGHSCPERGGTATSACEHRVEKRSEKLCEQLCEEKHGVLLA